MCAPHKVPGIIVAQRFPFPVIPTGWYVIAMSEELARGAVLPRRYFGRDLVLFRTQDGGRTWRSLCDEAHSPSTANIHGLTPDPETAGGVVIGTDTGEVWKVSDTAKWSKAAEGMPSVQSLLVTTS